MNTKIMFLLFTMIFFIFCVIGFYPSTKNNVKSFKKINQPCLAAKEVLVNYVKFSKVENFDEIKKLVSNTQHKKVLDINLENSKLITSDQSISDYDFLSLQNPHYLKKNSIQIGKMKIEDVNNEQCKISVEFMTGTGLLKSIQTFFFKKENDLWKIQKIIYGNEIIK